jgi:hypothetical protein
MGDFGRYECLGATQAKHHCHAGLACVKRALSVAPSKNKRNCTKKVTKYEVNNKQKSSTH